MAAASCSLISSVISSSKLTRKQKQRIVSALQHHGNSVGYLGDGVDDEVALHAVGVGIAGAGDLALQSADNLLLSRILDVLRQAVDDGRRSFAHAQIIPFLGSATALLGFVPLSARDLFAVVVIVGDYVIATEIAKAWQYQQTNTAFPTATAGRSGRR